MQSIGWGGIIISIAVGCLTQAEYGWIGVGITLVIVGILEYFSK